MKTQKTHAWPEGLRPVSAKRAFPEERNGPREYEAPEDEPGRVLTTDAAIQPETGKCLRCKERFGKRERCTNCGVGRHRVIRNVRRRNIGGKRGKNSGKVSQHGKKG